MALRWNAEQLAIYELIQAGAKNRDLKAKGYSLDVVRKVRTAVNKGDTPPEREKETPSGEPLYSATLKTTKVTLDPIIAVRHDSVRHALGWGDEYTLEQFLDQCTEIITELVGAVPPGFVREEAKEGVE